MEDNQLGSAATGSRGLCTDDTTSTEVVDPSSFVAVGDRMLVQLGSSFSTALPGDHQATSESSDLLVEEPPTIGEKILRQRKRTQRNWSSKPVRNSSGE